MIEESPDELLKVPGIGKVRVWIGLKQAGRNRKKLRISCFFLQSHEVSTSHATKIFKTYGSESIEIVKENPYRLADDIWGIGLRQQIPLHRRWG